MTRTRTPVAYRAPGPTEDVILATAAAERLNKSRQAIDTGIREGRIPGFKSTVDDRVYVDVSYVETQEHAAGIDFRALVQRVADLEREVQQGTQDSRDRDRARIEAVEAANLLIVSASEELRAELDARRIADKRIKQYRRALARAQKHADAAAAFHRDAVRLLSTPDTPGDLR